MQRDPAAMNHLAFAKLWKRSKGKIPRLRTDDYPVMLKLMEQLHRPSAQFWGVIDNHYHWRGQTLIHCFNFGNTTVKFPWYAEAVNFGTRLPLAVEQSGTIKPRRSFRTLLHQIEAPFLVFQLGKSNLAEERLETGLILTQPNTAQLRTTCEVVMMPGEITPSDGLFYYYMMKRINFTGEKIADLELPHAIDRPLPRFRMRFTEPMLVEPGWAFPMLEKDRWMWGIVSN